MTIKYWSLFVALTLLGATFAFIPHAFAVPEGTALEMKCKAEVDSNKPISPDCELLNLINEEIEARMAADNALNGNFNRKFNIISRSMTQDSSVCDNIPDADKVADTSLGDLCNQADTWIANYEAMCNNIPYFRNAVGGIATGTVAAMNGINNNVINPLKNFNTNVIEIPGFSLDIGLTDISFPSLGLPSFEPFSAFQPIPNNAITIAGNAINSVEDCTI
jgi:hypothetical protein